METGKRPQRRKQKMTIANPDATAAYLHALNEMPSHTKPAEIAAAADRMSVAAFHEAKPGNLKGPKDDAMMNIETAIFTAMCDANGVDWRMVAA
jgi:hypothetical protein